MSGTLVIYLAIAVAVFLVIAYAIAIYVRKRNESKLAILEEKKEELYNLLRISKIIFLRQKAITTHSVFSRPVIK